MHCMYIMPVLSDVVGLNLRRENKSMEGSGVPISARNVVETESFAFAWLSHRGEATATNF